jgi:hypothetical protein
MTFVEQLTSFTNNKSDMPPDETIPVRHRDMKHVKTFEENSDYIDGLDRTSIHGS